MRLTMRERDEDMESFAEKDKSVREEVESEEAEVGKGGAEVPSEKVEQQDDPEPEGGKASGQSGLNA
ncbi:hypothetical protein BN871_BK_00150 [Paenibacillus sp. P22]|nr:hypothetical protein BN871_BK_00150 [Paenibacillus sp. P22]